MVQTHAVIESPVGALTLVNTDGALSGLRMGSRWSAGGHPSVGERVVSGFERTVEELGEYFAGDRREFTVPTAARGHAFQRRVWDLIRQIPFGQTRSYGDLARDLGDLALARAVGAATGRNPIGIVVPCHRVIGSDGSLTGYAGGLERKRYLLHLEASVADRASTLF
ncbi:MAG TPA: methylated-DNA--[protein]-cysteine S-methyltransferase [Actinomycetota bacterium]|jgi:methylated-DNA-[protein]-cysteine S-methyltransferase|nr:methylated-DNA--[protein]-cysteine S-methyltransferase [Actinomycetota bacterium]